MTKRLKYLVILVAMLVLGQMAQAAEVSRQMENYNRWKDLPILTLRDKSNEFWWANKLDSALVCKFILTERYNESMSRDEKNICVGAYVSIGKMYQMSLFDNQAAYRYLLKAEKLAKKEGLEMVLADQCETMAIFQAIQTDLESDFSFSPNVIKLFQKSFYRSVKSGHYRTAFFSFRNLAYYAMLHQHINDIGNEIQAFRKLEIPDSINFKPYFQELCECYFAHQQGKHQEALDRFSRLGDLLPNDDSPVTISRERYMNCVSKYEVLLSLNRDAEALLELDNAYKIIFDYKIGDAIPEVLHLILDYYASHGKDALAKEYELKYFKAKDEYINRSKFLSAEQQQFLIDFEEMGDQVKDLKTQKRIRDLVILGIGIFAVLAIGILLFLWRNYQQTKQRNVLLFKKNQELLSLEAQVREHKSEMPHEPSKYKSSPMDEPAKAELLQQLQEIMESHQEVFEEGFTLDQLARLADSNRNYVSQVINEMMGCNFNTFVNEYRIKEACRRLSDTANFGGLTIEAVGQSVGFKSRTNFAATFKKFTGMTPAAYQRLANPSNA